MKKLSWVLIIIGILFFIYPVGEEAISRSMQKNALEALNKSIATEFEPIGEDDETPGDEEAKTETKKDDKVIGSIEIKKINLFLPIINGTSSIDLKRGIGKLKGSSDPGEVGNFVLAGHRSHTHGRNFNRLNEVEIGDEIIIKCDDITYVYIVVKKVIVEADDLSVIKKSEEQRIITLITCHPMKNPTHRLIVQGELKN